MDHDKKHWKAAKVNNPFPGLLSFLLVIIDCYCNFNFNLQALIIVMPMLGFGYLITMVGPDKTTTPWAYTVFQIVRSVVLSTQVGVGVVHVVYIQ